MSTICGFDHIENKDTLYHEKDCMKKLCTKKSLLTIKIIKKTEIIFITQVNIEAQHIVFVI